MSCFLKSLSIELLLPQYSFMWQQLRQQWLDLPLHEQNEFFIQKIRNECIHGIPNEHRCWVYPVVITFEKSKLNVSSYTQLSRNPPEWIREDSSLSEVLKRIIAAVVKLNPSIRYSPGLCRMAEFLLEYVDEETAFWATVLIVQVALPEYHTKSMTKLQLDGRRIEFVLQQDVKEVYTRLNDVGIQPSMYYIKWMLCLFVGILPNSIVLKLIDWMFGRGLDRNACSKMMVAANVTLFELGARDILATQSTSEAMDVLNDFIEEEVKVEDVAKDYWEACLERVELIDMEIDVTVNRTVDTTIDGKLNQDSIDTATINRLARSNTFPPKKVKHAISIHMQNFGKSKAMRNVQWRSYHELYKKGMHDTFLRDAVAKLSVEGIPGYHRSWAWPFLLADQIHRVQLGSVSFQELVQLSYINKEYCRSEIDIDVLRTSMLKEGQGEALRRVLYAYSIKNEVIGYCQGMNEIAAILLHYLDEESCFWVLSAIVEILLPDYHVSSMIGLHTDCAVLCSLLAKIDKSLIDHFHNAGLNMQIICTKWLVMLFTTSLSDHMALRIIDLLFAHGNEGQNASRVLLCSALAVLIVFSPSLMRLTDGGDIIDAISEMSNFVKSPKASNELLEQVELLLHKVVLLSEVEQLRKHHRDQVTSEFAAFQSKREDIRFERKLVDEIAAMMEEKKKPPVKSRLPNGGKLPTKVSKKLQHMWKKRPGIGKFTTFSTISNTSTSVNTDDFQELLSIGQSLQEIDLLLSEGNISSEEHFELQHKYVHLSHASPNEKLSPKTVQQLAIAIQQANISIKAISKPSSSASALGPKNASSSRLSPKPVSSSTFSPKTFDLYRIAQRSTSKHQKPKVSNITRKSTTHDSE